MKLKWFELVQYCWWFLAIALLWVSALWKFQPQEESIFFHYNVYFGIDWVGPWYLGYFIPVCAVALVSMNGVFMWSVWKKNRILADIILTWSSIALVFLVLSQLLVMLLNTEV